MYKRIFLSQAAGYILKKDVENKKTLFVILFSAVIGLLAAVLVYYRQSGEKEAPPSAETEKQLLEKLTAPTGKEMPAPAEVTKKLTAPKDGGPVPETVLDKLTSPSK
ncbi:MAG: hypothetical protein HYW91_02055 [Candidatus Sungbacteria bacterium]|nr:hypothetical protein [Candidatus Sungbacteria bacterium]